MLLETAIGEAKHLKGILTICWLDLANAFGSLPHDILEELLVSLPIPIELQSILPEQHIGRGRGRRRSWLARTSSQSLPHPVYVKATASALSSLTWLPNAPHTLR
jgi:hypothetical protein